MMKRQYPTMMQGDDRGTRRPELAECGERTVIHPSAVIVEPAGVRLGSDVTIEPLAVLMGHPDGELEIGDGSLIAPHAYLQGLGGLRIGKRVGVGAGVLMLTAVHAETPAGDPITAAPLRYGAIEVGDGCDLGVGSILLPGTRLAAGVQVGAGALVRGEHAAGAVIAGLPARFLRMRGGGDWASGLSVDPPRRDRRGEAGPA
jgi:acetyltransferase-like isoleucine patch superfamily enzyme